MTIKTIILIPMIVFTIFASTAVLISDITQFSNYVNTDTDKFA